MTSINAKIVQFNKTEHGDIIDWRHAENFPPTNLDDTDLALLVVDPTLTTSQLYERLTILRERILKSRVERAAVLNI